MRTCMFEEAVELFRACSTPPCRHVLVAFDLNTGQDKSEGTLFFGLTSADAIIATLLSDHASST